jgi:serine phosphatase RsbU (regulator of sigma subunit)
VFFKNASYKIYQQLGIGRDSAFIKNNSRGIVFGLFDSTGHGIPAALLSISGSLLLKELMTSMEISNPKILLNLLDYRLYNKFDN